MKKLILWGMVALVGLLPVNESLAQPQGPRPGKGPWASGRRYNPKTVETLAGQLVAVDTIASGRPDLPGRMTLSLKTNQETLTIYLGPAWFIEQQGMKLTVGDQVEVKGSRVAMEGKPLIIANYVKKGTQMLKLRDDRGLPLWRSGPGR